MLYLDYNNKRIFSAIVDVCYCCNVNVVCLALLLEFDGLLNV